MLPGLLVALIPILVSQAEKLFGADDGAKKREWVMGAMKEMEPMIVRVCPDWIGKNVAEIELLLDTAIEFALDKLEA